MMRIAFVLCLALFIVLSAGCSKKKEEAPVQKAPTPAMDRAGKVSPSFDPVSREEIDVVKSPYSYELDGVIYYFTSEENMELFKGNPQKYIDEIKQGLR